MNLPLDTASQRWAALKSDPNVLKNSCDLVLDDLREQVYNPLDETDYGLSKDSKPARKTVRTGIDRVVATPYKLIVGGNVPARTTRGFSNCPRWKNPTSPAPIKGALPEEELAFLVTPPQIQVEANWHYPVMPEDMFS